MKKIKDHLWLFLIFSCIILICFSGFQLYKTYSGYAEAQKTYEDTADRFVKPATLPASTEPPRKQILATTPAVEDAPKTSNSYPPIDVDFQSLQEEYEDIIAWIYSPDTGINYPVVQGEDNEYYLRRMANGYYNYSGCIFMDYRCESDFSDFNSTIYGHNMRDYSMFAPLLYYEEPGYYEQHPVIYLLTPEQDYEIRVFSGYITRGNAEIYDFGFHDRLRGSYLHEVLLKNEIPDEIDPDALPGQQDRTILLSTCDYSRYNGRYVIIGTLVPMARHSDTPS